MGFSSLYDIKILTLYEYEAQMYAFRLKQVDKERDMHIQAWINHQVTSTKEKGKKQIPVYKKFDEFFDYEKQIREVESQGKKQSTKTDKDIRMARAFKLIGERG